MARVVNLNSRNVVVAYTTPMNYLQNFAYYTDYKNSHNIYLWAINTIL